MNNHDRKNLEFLISADKDTIKEWYSTVEEDDHLYASELIAIYSAELKMFEILMEDTVDDLSMASEILNSYTLNK